MGLGHRFIFIMGLRGELRMIERALRQGWDTPPDKQRESFELIFSTLKDPNATTREKLAALRCIGAAIEHEGSTDAEILKRCRDAERYHIQKSPIKTKK